MGMTIEKCMEYMEAEYRCTVNEDDMADEEDIEALRTVLETMRKYQKIQEILNSASYTENGTVYSYTYDEETRVKHIRKVLEDGNVD